MLKDVDPADESVNLVANTRKGSRNYCSTLTTLRENLETQEAEKWKIWLSKDLSLLSTVDYVTLEPVQAVTISCIVHGVTITINPSDIAAIERDVGPFKFRSCSKI